MLKVWRIGSFNEDERIMYLLEENIETNQKVRDQLEKNRDQSKLERRILIILLKSY